MSSSSRNLRPRQSPIVILFAMVVSALQTQSALEADGSNPYERQASWAQTMVMGRENYLRWRVQEKASSGMDLGPWWSCGPLKAQGFSDPLFPETGVDLNAKNERSEPLWQMKPGWVDGAIHALSADGHTATYLFRTLQVQRDMTVLAGIGSDDGCALWLNGEQVLSQDVARGPAADQDRVTLNLRQGEDKILFKIFNRGGACGFYFAIQRDPVVDLWTRVAQDFPKESAWFIHDLPGGSHLPWFQSEDSSELDRRIIGGALDEAKGSGKALRSSLQSLIDGSTPSQDPAWLNLYFASCSLREALNLIQLVNFRALSMAIQDLTETDPRQAAKAKDLLSRNDSLESRLQVLLDHLATGQESSPASVIDLAAEILTFQREVLLANPLLNFDRLIVVKRSMGNLGLPQNWQGNCAMGKTGYDNEIDVLSPVNPEGELVTLYRPKSSEFVGDVDLHFDGDRMIFSMQGTHDRWQIWEMDADGSGLRQVTLGEEPDVDNYDACYLPNGRIAFASTRCFQGVPCVGGGNTVANLCLMDADGRNARQICFDQDHNWCPTVLNSGQLLYSRWEYSDTPHYFSRLLFRANPDGTGQMEYYGSNSYWPNSIFYARPIPNHPTQVVAIISGHHGVPRMGELVILDPSRGRFEAEGVVQRIPGYGQKVEPIVTDALVDASWPKFLHPYPLSDKYFLVSCQPTPYSLWGIYLVDVFDNMLLLCERPGYAMLEPIPFRKTARPPIIPDKVQPNQEDATVHLVDVYAGRGLDGVPRGTVKSLRLYEFHYAYPQMGGHINIGVEGPWDVHRILGTVPVYEDGSALFHVPANTPIAIQPLDEENRAVQIMRSWFVAMPGEKLSCVGCHESQNEAPSLEKTSAAGHEPSDIRPWYGPARGFSFKRDVQPVLDKRCVGCHNGSQRADGSKIPDFSRKPENGDGNFTPSYLALHPYVRRPGPESDYHLQVPLEFHASTSELVQMLERQHMGVSLDAEDWDRLVTWIDLNVPDHGTWGEHRAIAQDFHQRRMEMRTRYANRPEDPEAIPETPAGPVPFVAPAPTPLPGDLPNCPNWPMASDIVVALQRAAGPHSQRAIDLGDGVSLDLVLVPAGEFIMGSLQGPQDNRPMTRVRVDRPFWMGSVEVTLAQFHRFDPSHCNGYLDQHNKDHNTPGYPIDSPDMPVVRVSWERAMAFCQWLSSRGGGRFSLPTEAQWEWACRAGTAGAMNYGDVASDFSTHANLSDRSTRLLAVQGINPEPMSNPDDYNAFVPRNNQYDDKAMVMTSVRRYQPNAWGFYDMHGNAAEWTLSAYLPYPYDAKDGREDPAATGNKVVRGGSWRDRPLQAASAARGVYPSWQRVYNVGFRVACEARDVDGSPQQTAAVISQ